ncbi:hypothetical protein LINGRAHAP2_LOCUS14744, partial [Linum grandiflorum]
QRNNGLDKRYYDQSNNRKLEKSSLPVLSKYQQGDRSKRDEEKKEDDREGKTCFKCGRTGHFRVTCPFKSAHRDRAMAATLSDSDSEDSDSDGQTHALMALEEGESS